MTVRRAAEWIAENDTLTSRRGHRIAYRRRGSGPTARIPYLPKRSVAAANKRSAGRADRALSAVAAVCIRAKLSDA